MAVSLERLQVNIVKASLRPNKAPIGVPLGAGVGAGGVARTAQKEAAGEDVPPAELSCKASVVLKHFLDCFVVGAVDVPWSGSSGLAHVVGFVSRLFFQVLVKNE